MITALFGTGNSVIIETEYTLRENTVCMFEATVGGQNDDDDEQADEFNGK